MHRKALDVRKLMQYRDPRDMPAYSISEAAHYLSMPQATVRSWVLGMGEFKRVIELPRSGTNLLSFFNLAEAHVLRALRCRHGVRLPVIRKALKFVRDKFGWDRPLIQQEFRTDGARIFVEYLDKLVEASAEGQVVMQEILEAHLERLEWENNLVVRLYPFTRETWSEAPKTVFIDPRYSFGRPILGESHIPTAVIAERYKAGDSIDHLAIDYGCARLEIEEAVRCELRSSQAA
jgi:uncharacterized protein (DUF433 family)